MDCPVCGHDNRAQAKFCEECAALLPRAQPDPSSFTPVDLAEKIRRQRPSEGERRTVTVLFVDAVGSTPLAEKLGEEEMYSLMREALSRMSEAVHAYEGHVATFTGDGMMALFGAPIAHEDSARRAIAAALRMQSALEEYGHGVEQHHGVPCREALTLTEKGDYEQALSTFFRVNAMTERMGDAFRRGRVLNSIGWLYNEVAHHDEALSWNVRAVEFAQAYPAADAEMESNARLNLADTLMALGRLDEADEHFAWVERVVRQPTPKERWVLYRYSQHLLHSYGEFWLQRGKPRRALDYADECLSRAEATGAARYVVKARRLRGQALMVLNDLEGAEREIILALGVAQKLGNPPQLWMTHAAMGELRRAQGRTEDARGAYGVAISIIEDVGRSLKDKQLRETFLGSKHVEGIRQAAELRP